MENLDKELDMSQNFYNPNTNNWDEVWPCINKIEEECFPGKGLGEPHLKKIFEDPESIVVLLKQGEKIIGFTCGIPDTNSEESLYIETTEIISSHQGSGYVARLMTMLEREAQRRNYQYLTRDAEIENGYADKIFKNYGDRVTETHDHESEYSVGGMQRYFKIKL